MSSPDARDTISPDDRLPPVEPPSAGFLVQLFVIPALIVLIMFAVGAGIKWLVDRESDPTAYVQALKRNNDARWQAAHDLADILRNPRNEHLKSDERLAASLARILDDEIEAGSMDENALQVRVYLCHALGEFRVTEVLPALVKAALTERGEAESVVRFSALKALAVHLSNSAQADLTAEPKLIELLLDASRDDKPLIRSTAAFALGSIGDERARDRLRTMLGDSAPDVRYNAATMLARLGDERSVDVLEEMLDPQQLVAADDDEESASRGYKRDLILVNGLRAAGELAARNRNADLSGLAQAAQRLADSQEAAGIRVEAQKIVIELNKPRS